MKDIIEDESPLFAIPRAEQSLDPTNDKIEYNFGTKIQPHMDWDKEMLSFTTAYDNLIQQHFKEVIDFKEKCVRMALIGMGWTPPEGCESGIGKFKKDEYTGENK